MQTSDTVLRRSAHLSAFAHMGDVYLYHDLYGYILKMSPDILDFVAAFAEPHDVAAMCERYDEPLDGQAREFADILTQFSCLVPPDEDEIEGIWYMVPVKGKWNVWRRDDDALTLFTAWGDRPVSQHTLRGDEVALWDAIDGERRLSQLKEEFDAEMIVELISRLVQHDVQAVKLSAFPMSTYKGRSGLRPPYLTSTMPYAPYERTAGPPRSIERTAGPPRSIDPTAGPPRSTDPEHAAAAAGAPGDSISTASYYRDQVANAVEQFDHKETTLSHLLRVPHPVLGDRTYGQALVDALLARDALPASATLRTLEIGAGLGYVARDVCTRLREEGRTVDYQILELSPPLAVVQRERLSEHGVAVREGDALEADLGSGFQLILANEIIGDLPAVKLRHVDVGLGSEWTTNPEGAAGVQKQKLAALGEAGRIIAEYGLVIVDAPDPFYLNVGAIQLLERLWHALAPGGTCVVTEFGEMGMYPRLSTQLDHPELSIHFGHLQTAARGIGFDADFEFVIDLLDFDRTLRGMATTRSYFRALQAMLAERGVGLQKIGYTEAMFDALIAGAVSKDAIGDLYFDRVEDRLMGLVPHEFKALILRRPA